MPVRDWFREFRLSYTQLCPRGDWPDRSDLFWVELEGQLEREGITESDATKASRDIFRDQPSYLGDHPKRLLAAALKHRAARLNERAKDAPPAPLPSAKTADELRIDAFWADLTADERGAWLDFVRERAPELSRIGNWCELLAKHWASDPSQVWPKPPPAPPSPPAAAEPRGGPRRLFGGKV